MCSGTWQLLCSFASLKIMTGSFYVVFFASFKIMGECNLSSSSAITTKLLPCDWHPLQPFIGWLGYGLGLTSEHFILGFRRPFVLGLCLASRGRKTRDGCKTNFVMSIVHLVSRLQVASSGRNAGAADGAGSRRASLLSRRMSSSGTTPPY